MTDPTQTSDAGLRALLAHSAVVPDPQVRHAWQALVPELSTDQRYALAAILLDVEQALDLDLDLSRGDG